MPRKNNDPRSPNISDDHPHRDKRLRLAIGDQDPSYLPLFKDSLKDNDRNSESSN